jgi:hypothetical protein
MFNDKKFETNIKNFLQEKYASIDTDSSLDKKIISDSIEVYEKSITSATRFDTYIYKYLIRAAVLILIITALIFNRTSKNNVGNENNSGIAQHTTKPNEDTEINTRWIFDKAGYVRINSNNNDFSIIFDNVEKKGFVILNQEKKYFELKLENISNKKLESFLDNSADNFLLDKTENFVSLKDFEKMPIQINAEIFTSNETEINNFFASLIQYRNNGGVFPTHFNGNEFAKAAWNLSNQNMPAGIKRYLSDFEIVCP